MPSNAPVVGDRLFEIESGIVAGFWARCAAEYPLELFPFHWSEVGQPEPRVVYGKGSGLPTLDTVDGAGPGVPESTRREILMAIKQAAIDRKDLISAEETRTIVKRVLAGY